MAIKHSILFLVALSYSFCVNAQKTETYTSNLADYQTAISLFKNNQYQAAQNLFLEIKKSINDDIIESDCAYYIANCAVRLNQQNADRLVEDFVDNYPTSTKRNTAFIAIGDYFFKNGKYAYARKWYGKVDQKGLSKTDADRFNFNYGYTAFMAKQYKEAKTHLSRVENSKKYGSQAKYYIGYMAYQGDDYNQANAYFDQVGNQEQYKDKLSYYQADLNFKLGNFEKAIELAKAKLTDSDANEVSELSKIIGESYFNLQQYANALPYLQAYKGKNGKWSNTDFYQLGYTYYKQEYYDKAVSEFNKIIDGKTSVAQNAYYHLGESYIKLGKKQEALNAFKNASEMDFDLSIQEDAFLNYAKLSYDIGNAYQPAPQVLSAYLDKYPKTEHKDTIETLLIDSYITSKNYKEALELLKGKNSFENKVAYQKVAFYRGLELYNEGKYLEANTLFKASLNEPRDANFTARATFWQAETDYNLTNYEAALIGFKQFEQQTQAANTPEYKNLDYNIAYAYFKLKNYNKTITHINAYLSKQNPDDVRLNDSYLRLGDSYFVSSNYTEAINAYQKAIALDITDSDYAFFQKAISAGYIGQDSKKIQELEAFINSYPTSKLRDDALFELGNTYVKTNNTHKADQAYNQLNAEYTTSEFVPKALLRQGLVFYNANKNNDALLKFKTVAKNYPGTTEAVQAIATARLIYIDMGRVNDYASWVKTLDYIEVSDTDLDNASYQAAEKQYLDNNSKKAISQFNSYLSQFPKGIHALQAHFYLAQLYYKDDLLENAAPHYKAVIAAPKNEFTDEALTRLSQYYLENKDWKAALPILQRLETQGSQPQHIIFAESNLMKANYELKDYTKAVNYAEKVLKQSKIDNKIKGDAHIIIARSAIKTGNETKAKAAYAEVEKVATGETAAEALYYKAYFKTKALAYETSNTIIQKLAKDYSGYKYYSAKGLVLMAKNFYALNDAFQATYILESVIANFQEYNDIVAEAKNELHNIKTEQAKTNSSIITED